VQEYHRPVVDKAEFDQLRWASRRGMLELDLLLLPFVDARLQQLDEPAQEAYRRLLECTDQALYVWLTGRKAPPPEHRAAVQRIREYAGSVPAKEGRG